MQLEGCVCFYPQLLARTTDAQYSDHELTGQPQHRRPLFSSDYEYSCR